MTKVAKFGGTSMATAEQMKKAAEITKSDDYIVTVVSAPGKRFKGDIKVTDLLYEFEKDKTKADAIFKRLEEIEIELGISHMASEHFMANKDTFVTTDQIASRGEYYSAMIFAQYTGRVFLDTAELIIINDNGVTDIASYYNIKKAIEERKKYVAPGFYGKDKNGKIKTFSRGGSDITGSIFAKAIGADIYENWTDVSGVFNADPNTIKNAHKIDEMTYTELLLLGENGAQVFHPLAVEPVKDLIPINIRNTNEPEKNGTIIKSTRDYSKCPIIAVTEKDETISVIGEGKIIEQQKNAKLEDIYKKYFS